MTEPADGLFRGEVAFWVRGSLLRDMRNELRASGKRPPGFAEEVLAVLAEASGHAVDLPIASASGTEVASLGSTSWISVREAAAGLGVSESRIRQLARSHRIRAQRFGREWQIDPESLTRRTA